MTNKQNARFEAIGRIKGYTVKHAAELATIPEAAAEITVLNANYDILANAQLVQEDVLGGSADAAYAARLTMATVCMKYAKRAAVKAKQLKNSTLYEKLHQPITFISKAKKNVALSRAGDIKKALNDNLATLTNVTAANIAEIGNAITAYTNLKDVPENEIAVKKSAGTNVIPDALNAGMDAGDNIYELMHSYFYDVKKTIVDELGLLKQVHVAGVHHTGIEGEVTVNGVGVEGVVISAEGTKKKAVTDIYGHYSLIRMKPGDFHLTCSLSTGEKQSEIVHITKGSIDTHDFHF